MCELIEICGKKYRTADVERLCKPVIPTAADGQPIRLGDRFNRSGESYIVAQVDANLAKLINLRDGNRFSDKASASSFYVVQGLAMFAGKESEFERVSGGAE